MPVTVTQQPRVSKYGRELEKVSVAWTSDAGGAATGVVPGLYGFVIKVVTDPTDGPTDNYDITLIDENGADAMISQLLDRDTTNTETVYPYQSGASIPVFVVGDHTFTIANAGSAKSGVAHFYITECL